MFLLDATRHVRFSAIIFRLPIFLFVHGQECSCAFLSATHKYWLSGIVHFLFFREDYAETDIVLFLIFRIGLIKSAVLSSGLSTGHLPIASEGTSYKMAMPVPFRISPCLSRPEIRRTSVSAIWPCSLFLYGHNIYPFFCHIFFIFISFRMVFSLFFGKGSAREIPFFHRKNNKEEQAGFRQSHEPNHAEPWLSIDY